MDDVAKLKDRAAKAWSKGNWGAAVEAYEELFKAEPKNLMHKLRVGDALVKAGKTADAIAVYAALAERYAADAMLIKAISVNKLILQLDPQQKDTQKRLAALYSKRGVATVAARSASAAVAAGKKDMEVPAADEGGMVVESGSGGARVIATPDPASQPPVVKGAIVPPPPSPEDVIAAAALATGSTAAPIAAPVFPTPQPQPVAPPPASQSLAAEIIELGPSDVSLGPEPDDADVDSLFEDVGEIPQVPPTPLFSDLQPAEFERMIELLAPIRVPEGTDICREGEPATSMFVIAQGSVQVYFTDPNGNRVDLAKLAEGDFFGEFALFEGGVRKASVSANEETELLELSKENFDLVVSEFPAAAGVLRMFYYARLADTFLAKSPIFGSLDREMRWDYVRKMTLQRYHPGQPILREGETGDALFMIRTGTVQIFTGSGPDAIKLADLPAGEIFGEIAVINLQPRTATVIAGTEVELYRLDRESARRMLGANASIAGKVKDIAEARVRSTIDAMITGSVGNTGRA